MCARTHLGCLRQGEYDSTLAVATKLGTFQHSVVLHSPLGKRGLITRSVSITVGWLPTVQTDNVSHFFRIVNRQAKNSFARSRDVADFLARRSRRQPMPSAVPALSWQSGRRFLQFAGFPGSPADVHGSWPISTAVGRFPRQVADFHGSWPISTAVRRFPRQLADFHGSSPTFTAVRRVSRNVADFPRSSPGFAGICRI